MKQTYTAGDIVNMLRLKHVDDVVVDECKDGPTQSVRHFKQLDVLVMRRSWTHPCVIGYEIKVSRSDFLQDVKWRGYLSLCNEFYFACPKGLIQPEELPAEVGLLWTAGTRFVTKRKAVHRAVQIPENLFRYIIMVRSKICRDKEDKSVFWRQWLVDRESNQDLGHNVSRAVQKQVRADRQAVLKMKQEVEALQYLKDRAVELGCDPKTPVSSWNIAGRLNDFMGKMPSDTDYIFQTAITYLKQAQEIAKEARTGS